MVYRSFRDPTGYEGELAEVSRQIFLTYRGSLELCGSHQYGALVE